MTDVLNASVSTAVNASEGVPPSDSSPSGAGTPPAIQLEPASAKRFLPSRGASEVRFIVLHTMETDLLAGTASNLAKSWSVPPMPGHNVSAHYCVDSGEVFECVREDAVAFHAGPKANRISIGVEHAGWAKFDAATWNSEPAQTMLALSAQLVADICRRRRIPVVFVEADQLKNGQRGITTHAAVSKGLGGTNHTDPGASFPIDDYLKLVSSFL